MLCYLSPVHKTGWSSVGTCCLGQTLHEIALNAREALGPRLQGAQSL